MASRKRPERQKQFYEVLSEAIDDMTAHGFDSQGRMESWLKRLSVAARYSLIPADVLERNLKDFLARTFRSVTGQGGKLLLKKHRGLDTYTLAAIHPRLRSELDRRILASAGLIKSNREQSIARTLQRFQGWATSLPIGGTEATDKPEVRKNLRKAMASLPFEERRVIIDQGHKLTAAINQIVAEDGGAIAAIWHHVHERNYNARPEHLKRDGKIYVVRENWAIAKGFMKLAGHEYTDQLTAPGEEIFCRCRYEYIYTLRDLPARMLTERGQTALKEARSKIEMMQPTYRSKVAA